MYTPFTGLGKFNGFRGNRWLANRITVFKSYVVPSLQAQTSKNFTLWVSWRREEKSNPLVKELMAYMDTIKEFKTIHTFAGVCFYDDKYPDEIARDRLINALHGSMPELLDEIGGCEEVLMTIQPSDDCYKRDMVETVQALFKKRPDLQAVGFTKGYICNYLTKEVAEYNPKTNPPFYTLRFFRDIFIDPYRHAQYTALKHDVEGYKKGTPLPSHEWVGDCLKYGQIHERGFLVGVHKQNISTSWQIPYKGEAVSNEVLRDFGIYNAEPIKLSIPLRRRLLFSLPYKVQRKLRYWLTEKLQIPL